MQSWITLLTKIKANLISKQTKITYFGGILRSSRQNYRLGFEIRDTKTLFAYFMDLLFPLYLNPKTAFFLTYSDAYLIQYSSP